ncbi:MAG: type II secretion system protein GspK [Gammaproteobacteria bacterium]|nr:type II secretion system protein GspK [Gammaproteobacteria bacterium]
MTRGARGFALIIVLWAGVLLGIIATSFAFTMRTETQLTANTVQLARARALADAGIELGILSLIQPPRGTVRWLTDGRVYTSALAGGTVRVRLLSENGKIDLNSAPEGLIVGLLESLADVDALALSADEAHGIADAIIDWRDADSRRRPRGAEDADYRGAGRAYGARDGAFLSVAELNQVLGMRADVYAALAPVVTVDSWMPQIDPGTASRRALLAVPGLDAGSVDAFLAMREAAYAGAEQGAAEERDETRLPLELLSAGARYLSRAKSRVYTVEAEGELADGARARRRAVGRLTGDGNRPYTIVAWLDTVPDAEALTPQ